MQECLEKMDVANMRLHATGLQTCLKLVENDLNNVPLGYSYSRDSNNSPLLRLIFPNLLKIGRLNTRALDGPIRMPAGPGELMEKIERGYSSFFKIFNTTMIPKLMKINKWFDNNGQLQVGDIVWFKKTEKELTSDWTLGKVVSITKSKDGLVRRAEIQYQNVTENEPRTTDRAVRSLIKLFNLEDTTWLDDMKEIEEFINKLKNDDENIDSKAVTVNTVIRSRHEAVSGHDKPQRVEGVQFRPSAKITKSKLVKKCKNNCCCVSHCQITDHHLKALPVVIDGIKYDQEHLFPELVDRSGMGLEEFEEDVLNVVETEDMLLSYLCALHTNFEDEGAEFLAKIL